MSKSEGSSAKSMGQGKTRKVISGEYPMTFPILSSTGICCKADSMWMRKRLVES
jgi:hypothetical protein